MRYALIRLGRLEFAPRLIQPLLQSPAAKSSLISFSSSVCFSSNRRAARSSAVRRRVKIASARPKACLTIERTRRSIAVADRA